MGATSFVFTSSVDQLNFSYLLLTPKRYLFHALRMAKVWGVEYIRGVVNPNRDTTMFKLPEKMAIKKEPNE